MRYSIDLTKGGWVIHCYHDDNYIGDISDDDGNTSKVESLAFFDKSMAENYVKTKLS